MVNFYYYDKKIDDLIISNKELNEKVKKNFIFDDFIISLTGSGKVVALEIKNASKFLIDSGRDPKILNDVKEVILEVVPRKNFIGIYIGLMIAEQKNIIEMRIPITHLPMEAVTY